MVANGAAGGNSLGDLADPEKFTERLEITGRDPALLKAQLRTMLLIRRVEEKIGDGVTEGKIVCPCHLGTYDIYDSAKVRFGPPPDPLDQLKMLIEDDLIKVEFTRYKYGNGTVGGQIEDNPYGTA